MKIKPLTKYDKQTTDHIRQLLIQLSRSGKDRGEIPESWFTDLINSDSHDMLLAYDDDNNIIGIATLSIIMGPIVRKIAYLEDFVTDTSVRSQGVGTALWNAMLSWGKSKGCTELNFTSGPDRTAAQAFYKNKGAEIYPTNFFRLPL